MATQYGNKAIPKNGLQLYYKFDNNKCFKGKAATNLIAAATSGGVTAYPTFGNGWGTYHDRWYNGGAFFNLGTVSSINSNVITFSSAHNYYTYDILQPQTTGGGVTSGVNYYIKRISSTQISLHAYNSTENGTQGFEPLKPVQQDSRIAISSSSFPTMWWGYPHLPNGGLIKTIIPDGFSYNNTTHDCIRLNWFNPVYADGMAYGIAPVYDVDTVYTFRCWIRAANPDTVGKRLYVSMYFSGITAGLGAVYSPYLTTSWQEWTYTVTSPSTAGIVYWYFWTESSVSTYYIQADIAQFQWEPSNTSSEFTVTGRSNNSLAGGGGLIDLSGNNLNYDLTSFRLDSNDIYFEGNTNSISLPYSSNFDANNFAISFWSKNTSNSDLHKQIISRNSDVYGNVGNGWSLSKIRNGLYAGNNYRFLLFGNSTSSALNIYGPPSNTNVWQHIVVTVDKTNSLATMYVNGVPYSSSTSLPLGNYYPSSGSPALKIACDRTNIDQWVGLINNIKFYNKVLSATEVSEDYYSQIQNINIYTTKYSNYGDSINPGLSAADILRKRSGSLSNGLYYIRRKNVNLHSGETQYDSTSIQTYCDFTTQDGNGESGWMLVGSWTTGYNWAVSSNSTATALSTSPAECFSANFGNEFIRAFRVTIGDNITSTIGINSSADWYYYWNSGLYWKQVWAWGQGTFKNYINDTSGTSDGNINASFHSGWPTPYTFTPSQTTTARVCLRGFNLAYNIRWGYASTTQRWVGLSDSGGGGTSQTWSNWWKGLTTAGVALQGSVGGDDGNLAIVTSSADTTYGLATTASMDSFGANAKIGRDDTANCSAWGSSAIDNLAGQQNPFASTKPVWFWIK